MRIVVRIRGKEGGWRETDGESEIMELLKDAMYKAIYYRLLRIKLKYYFKLVLPSNDIEVFHRFMSSEIEPEKVLS